MLVFIVHLMCTVWVRLDMSVVICAFVQICICHRYVRMHICLWTYLYVYAHAYVYLRRCMGVLMSL